MEHFLTHILPKRFHEHMHRHPNITWDFILSILSTHQDWIDILMKMEETGGEPDVFVYENHVLFVDFSKETPEGRRNACFDEEARLGRKKFPPAFSAKGQASEFGIQIVDENLYRAIQQVEALDLKTSSWLETPSSVRKLGGALFGDRRYNRVFTYHNGADSYYGVRGYRGYLQIS